MRRSLEAPNEFARIRLQCDDAASPGVVTRSHSSVEDRSRVACADINEIQLRIIGAGHPHLAAGRSSARRFGRARRWCAVENPLRFARVRINGLQLPR